MTWDEFMDLDEGDFVQNIKTKEKRQIVSRGKYALSFFKLRASRYANETTTYIWQDIKYNYCIPKGGEQLMRRRFILIKDTPELKIGAILEEECDDGTQGFRLINKDYQKYDDQKGTSYSRKTVIEGTEYFQEVEQLWLTKEEVSKVKEIIKK